MTVHAITDTKKGRTGIAPTYLQTTQYKIWRPSPYKKSSRIFPACLFYMSTAFLSLSTAVHYILQPQMLVTPPNFRDLTKEYPR